MNEHQMSGAKLPLDDSTSDEQRPKSFLILWLFGSIIVTLIAILLVFLF